jgi:hypothetical protein
MSEIKEWSIEVRLRGDGKKSVWVRCLDKNRQLFFQSVTLNVEDDIGVHIRKTLEEAERVYFLRANTPQLER